MGSLWGSRTSRSPFLQFDSIIGMALIGWWLLWHTDTLLVAMGYFETAVMVRALVPWPTAFVWVSWAVTLWLLALIATTFAPKIKRQASDGGQAKLP